MVENRCSELRQGSKKYPSRGRGAWRSFVPSSTGPAIVLLLLKPKVETQSREIGSVPFDYPLSRTVVLAQQGSRTTALELAQRQPGCHLSGTPPVGRLIAGAGDWAAKRKNHCPQIEITAESWSPCLEPAPR